MCYVLWMNCTSVYDRSSSIQTQKVRNAKSREKNHWVKVTLLGTHHTESQPKSKILCKCICLGFDGMYWTTPVSHGLQKADLFLVWYSMKPTYVLPASCGWGDHYNWTRTWRDMHLTVVVSRMKLMYSNLVPELYSSWVKVTLGTLF